MPTKSQIAANQKNAQLSTGPTSETGKAISSLNAVKTGLTGRTVLLPGDDAAAYEMHVARFIERFQPAGDEEQNIVQSLADTEWRLLRIPSLELGIYALGRLEFAELFPKEEEAVRNQLIEAKIFLAYQRQFKQSQHPGKSPAAPPRKRYRGPSRIARKPQASGESASGRSRTPIH